jgi:[glutamine synthetase] adenylyltransferase / [glutamine synthetase]-adenylyl-L-tyrosine phosphorylase
MHRSEPDDIEKFISTLPDPAGARAFLSRLRALDPGLRVNQEHRTLAHLLTLAGNSPFLGETLLRHPEHIAWLKLETERTLDRVKSREQLSEDLARFVTRTMNIADAARLSRFKRRALLRIYLRDCLGIATLSELTEELSNLADVIIEYSLARAMQDMTNLHGPPQTTDNGGRIEKAEFAVIALGKLGCRELNYASDIDLFFLYSGDGETSGGGRTRESSVANKEFFTGVAERVIGMIGRNSEEGAVYRVDLRLRPYGRDGDLVWEINRAANYYRNHAHNWERQALIRARACAGTVGVVDRFLEEVRDSIFSKDALPETLEEVRRAKEKIDKQEAARVRGFNVKLGPGGIREIEFIAQALQLKHGGREPWVRSAQTLIVLARLAEKNYLTEVERAKLSAAYTFLRTVEHRLQMEHGAQIHTLPASHAKLELLARRCGFARTDDPVEAFMEELRQHSSAVRAIHDRVFLEPDDASAKQPAVEAPPRVVIEDENSRLITRAAMRFARAIQIDGDAQSAEAILARALPKVINPSRALRNLAGWADSMATYVSESPRREPGRDWKTLIDRLFVALSSPYLSHLLVSRPMLAAALVDDSGALSNRDFLRELQTAVEAESDPALKSFALRRAWHKSIVRIGYRDMSSDRGAEQLRESNLAQTALAESTLRIALQITLDAMSFAIDAGDLPLAILALGRLGHAGMDYGSDLDLLVVFDDESPWPPPSLSVARIDDTPHEFYARLISQLISVLSSLTREGFLYRTDLRLRPEGKSGPVIKGLTQLVGYITDRASAWEHTAYLKAREVAGDLRFGKRVREAICNASFDAARRNRSLRAELRDMRARQLKEKARSARFNIKLGRGGMSDVYFVTRYLQLRDQIYYPPELGTTALVARLRDAGSLDEQAARALLEGYTFLRTLDHWMRLLLDRPSPVLPSSSIARRDLSRALNLSTVNELEESLAHHALAIRRVHDRVFG